MIALIITQAVTLIILLILWRICFEEITGDDLLICVVVSITILFGWYYIIALSIWIYKDYKDKKRSKWLKDRTL